MPTILEAKKHLRELYRYEEGFLGVGVARRGTEDVLRVYVADARFPIAQQLRQRGEFEGFTLEVETTGTIQAFPTMC